jgi:hypothetical protein
MYTPLQRTLPMIPMTYESGSLRFVPQNIRSTFLRNIVWNKNTSKQIFSRPIIHSPTYPLFSNSVEYETKSVINILVCNYRGL